MLDKPDLFLDFLYLYLVNQVNFIFRQPLKCEDGGAGRKDGGVEAPGGEVDHHEEGRGPGGNTL